MKRFLVALGCLIGEAAAVHAGEMSWTGFYAGVNGGYGWSRGDVTAAPGDPNSQLAFGQRSISSSPHAQGWLGGVQAGYDWQFAARGVVGIEADIAAAGLEAHVSVPVTMMGGMQPATFDTSRSIDWFGTVRGRIGFLAVPDLLFYATGGLAYGRVSEAASVSLPPGQSNSMGNQGYAFACGPLYGTGACFAGSSARTSVGWTAGVGAEKRFTPNLSLKLEYLHVDLSSSGFPALGSLYSGTPFAPSFLNARASATFDLVRAGLNYRF